MDFNDDRLHLKNALKLIVIMMRYFMNVAWDKGYRMTPSGRSRVMERKNKKRDMIKT